MALARPTGTAAPQEGPGHMANAERMLRRSASREDDDGLCRAVALGDDSAFAELASRHRDWLVGLCRRNLRGDPHRAEDIAQECLIKLHATLQRDHRPLRPRAWLSVVARNACIDAHRARRAEPTEEVPDAGVDAVDPFDLDPILAEAWEALTDRHREVLQHRELIGLSYDEIAIAMDTSVSAVETLLFRARVALRRNYRRAGGQLLGCGLFGLSFMRLLELGTTPELDTHLAACGDCSRASARLIETTDLLRVGTTPAIDTAEMAISPLRTKMLEFLPTMGSLSSTPQMGDVLSGMGGVVAAVVVVAAAATGGAVAVSSSDSPDRPAAVTTANTLIEDSTYDVMPSPTETTIAVSVVEEVYGAVAEGLAPPNDRRRWESTDGDFAFTPPPAPGDEPAPCEPPDGMLDEDVRAVQEEPEEQQGFEDPEHGFDEAEPTSEWPESRSTTAPPPASCESQDPCNAESRCEPHR